jgi:hypothetical protein
MTRGSHRRESHVQSAQPTQPAAAGADGPAATPGAAPKAPSPGWSLAIFLWVTAFVVLSLFELLSAIFRR